MGRTSTCYLLHFDPPYRAPITGTDRVKEAGHYLGSTAGPVAERLVEHVAGRGSPLVKAAVAAGSRVLIGATWPGGRQEERKAKRAHHHARRCLICRTAQELSSGPVAA